MWITFVIVSDMFSIFLDCNYAIFTYVYKESSFWYVHPEDNDDINGNSKYHAIVQLISVSDDICITIYK